MKSLREIGRFIFNSLLAILAVALTSAVMVLLRGFFSTSVIALIYLLPVILSTALWGFYAGIVASILSFLTFNYFFLPPINTFRVSHSQDIMAMFVFLAVAVVISNLMGRAQTRLEEIQAREREATHLYELSVALTGLKNEKGIAEVLAQHLLEVFQATMVEVGIQLSAPRPPVHFRLPENTPVADAFQENLPLSTNRGTLGEIHLWRRSSPLNAAEERLFHTIAGQAALAVERAFLAEAETRAKILEESDRLKTAILSSVSHDLRTPLASIQAAATSLYNSEVHLEPEARLELQSLLLEETERLNQLVGNLLNMSRIEAGALKLQIQWNSIADVVDTAVARLHRLSTRHQLEIDVSEDLPLIQMDTVLIEQVLINLIDNSLKYAPIGSAIFLHAEIQNASWLLITVRNHGPSIPEEHLEHIFDKFFSFPGMDRSRSTGLGLSICKGIIEAHSGRIWATNLPDGMAFNFTLPLTKGGSLSSLPNEVLEPL